MLNLLKIGNENKLLYDKIMLHGQLNMGVMHEGAILTKNVFDLDNDELIEKLEKLLNDFKDGITALFVKHFGKSPEDPNFNEDEVENSSYDVLDAFYTEANEYVQNHINKMHTFIKDNT